MTKASLLKAAARQLELDPEGTIGVIEPGEKRPWTGYGKAWQTKWHRDLERLADEIDRSGATHLGYHPGPHVAVVDVDHPEKLAHELPVTHQVASQTKTPGRGHRYYRVDDDVTPLGSIPGGAGEIRRHGGGQVVFAGPGYKATPAEFADLPEWLTRNSGALERVQATDGDTWLEIPVGRQDMILTSLAGTLRRQGADERFIYAAVATLAEGMEEGDPENPWTDEDFKRIARSVSKFDPDPDRTYEIVDESGDTPAVLGDEPTYEEIATYYGLECVDDMDKLPPAEWWWKPYIPKGRLVLLDGDSGIGKGLFCADMAVKLVQSGARILWASTEDDPQEDIQNRLLAAGYEKGTRGVTFFNKRDPRFPTDIDLLTTLITEGKFDVLILDPGRSFLDPPPGTPMSYNDDHAVRYGLESIQRLAKLLGVTIIFVHHWNKDTLQGVKGRQSGSAAFTQVPRHRIAMAWHGPSQGGHGAFEVAKSNIGPTGCVHGYYIEEVLEHDTAKFLLGDLMPEFDNLGQWMKAQEREDKASAPIIDMTEEARAAILAMAPGAKINAVHIAAQLGTSTAALDDLLIEMLQDGELEKRGAKKILVRAEC